MVGTRAQSKVAVTTRRVSRTRRRVVRPKYQAPSSAMRRTTSRRGHRPRVRRSDKKFLSSVSLTLKRGCWRLMSVFSARVLLLVAGHYGFDVGHTLSRSGTNPGVARAAGILAHAVRRLAALPMYSVLPRRSFIRYTPDRWQAIQDSPGLRAGAISASRSWLGWLGSRHPRTSGKHTSVRRVRLRRKMRWLHSGSLRRAQAFEHRG